LNHDFYRKCCNANCFVLWSWFTQFSFTLGFLEFSEKEHSRHSGKQLSPTIYIIYPENFDVLLGKRGKRKTSKQNV